MTAFFLMYRMNNEYTARGEQPIQGILCLDEEKAAGKLHYLAREWQYFPGKLLTPDMLKENTGYYSRYISIGEYGGMELGAGIFPLENTEEWNWVTKMPLPMAAEPIG